jgi:hypothetical protein
MKLCPCERVAEKGDFGSCTQPVALTFFRSQAPSVQGFFEPPRQSVGHVFDTPLPLPSPRTTCFGSSSSVPKMGLSRSTLRVMAGGIYRMLFPSGFRPPSLSLGVYSLFQPDPRLKPWTHHHCHPGLCLPAHIGRFPFPAKRH